MKEKNKKQKYGTAARLTRENQALVEEHIRLSGFDLSVAQAVNDLVKRGCEAHDKEGA